MSDDREPRRKLKFTIDGVEYTTRDDDQEAAALLRLAGKDPDAFDLARVKKNGEQKILNDKDVVDVEDGTRSSPSPLATPSL